MVDDNDIGFSDNDSDGMADNTETTNEPDTDGDGFADYIDLDSDGDGCYDVVEAGFTDSDDDGYLGLSPTSQDSMGVVVSGIDGYTAAADNDNNGVSDFLEQGSQASFFNQPVDFVIYNDGDNISLNAEASSLSSIVYQWQYSYDDGFSWININNDTINGTIFTGSYTTTLEMFKVDKSFDNYLFQLVASTPG